LKVFDRHVARTPGSALRIGGLAAA